MSKLKNPRKCPAGVRPVSTVMTVSGLVFSLIISVSFLTNILVLVALIAGPALQQSSSIFFASMSLADLGVTVLGETLQPGVCVFRVYT